MPDKKQLNMITSKNAQDLKNVRLAGLDKPFEKLTLSELVQLRPGTDVADSYNVTAVTDNATISTSSALEELGRIQKIRTMNKVVDQARLNELKAPLTVTAPAIFGTMSAGPSPDSVALPRPEDDIFSGKEGDPFKA
ncbi:MAG: hypothetical protein KF747_04495 [Nitrospira sp.]|nr:hypothetical protein [Nitrospira sp.]